MIPLDLSGTVALVTGSAGGLGRGIARGFARAGADVAVHYRTSADAAQALVRELRTHQVRAEAVEADLRSGQECQSLVDGVVARFGRLDAVVNNAGVQPVQPLAELTIEDWRAVVDTNVSSTFAVTRAAAGIMGEQGGGTVTHIASIEGSHPARNHAHYCASKAAIIMHARSAALEYGPAGIRVNCVSPGLIDREGLAADWPEGVRRWRDSAPLTRLGTPEDVAAACVFLASPLAAWITGHNLVLDGGVSAAPTW